MWTSLFLCQVSTVVIRNKDQNETEMSNLVNALLEPMQWEMGDSNVSAAIRASLLVLSGSTIQWCSANSHCQQNTLWVWKDILKPKVQKKKKEAIQKPRPILPYLHVFVNFKASKVPNYTNCTNSVLTNCCLRTMEEADVLVWWKAQRERFSANGENSVMRPVRHASCFSPDSRQQMFTGRVIRLSLAVPHAHTLR